MRRLSTQVVALALAALGLSLIVVGSGTGIALWVQARTSLDEALLAAAAAEAHPRPTERWRTEHLTTPITVRAWSPGDPLVDDDVARATLRDESPRWTNRDGKRVLLLVAEPEDAPFGPDGGDMDHPHLLLVASAPALSVAEALGPFAVSYGLVSLLVATVFGGLLVLGLRRAMGPLDRATERLDDLGGREVGARVSVEGPEEVRRVLTATNGLLERLEVASEGQRRFVSDAAHELRTPVTRLLGELDLVLRQEREPEAYRTALARAREASTRLRDLVEALLTLARLDAGSRPDSRTPERASAVVLAALADERQTLEAAGCRVSVDLGPDPEVRVDVALCRVAIANLLRNAAIHAPGTPVRIRVAEADGAALICVEDGGPGLSDAARARVFERFHRGAHDRPGLGLGLPLAREVVRQHGGELALQDSELGGLAAVIRIPV